MNHSIATRVCCFDSKPTLIISKIIDVDNMDNIKVYIDNIYVDVDNRKVCCHHKKLWHTMKFRSYGELGLGAKAQVRPRS